jgi:hypothetical protein
MISRVFRRCVLSLSCLVLAGFVCRGQATLDPTLPPGQNFDLTRWKLQLPTSSADPNALLSLHTGVDEVQGTALTNYTSKYFYTNADGAMRFYAPITGDTTSGSDYPRSELRELYSSTQNSWFNTYGTAVLNGSLKVYQTPLTNKVIIGQIHGDVPNAVMLILEYISGSIEVHINYSPLVDKQVKLVLANVGAPTSGLITYQLKMIPGAVFTTVNGVTQAMLIDQTAATGWANASVYFKAGDYCQGNPSTEGTNPPANDGASTAFYSLKLLHVTSALQVATTTLLAGAAATPYSQTLQAANGSGGLTWSLVNGVIGVTGGGSTPMGTLPPGLTLSSSGVIGGTPDATTANKTYNDIVVQVTDTAGATAIQRLSIAIGATPVNPPPTVTAPPVAQTVVAGASANFTVGTTGSGLSYQWLYNGAVMVGATNSTLTLTNVGAGQAGSYSAVVSNVAGSVTSGTAALTVTSAPAVSSKISNLSIRSTAGIDAQTLIAGFSTVGGTKSLLVRGTGPALTQYGVTGVLADPQLKLYAGATVQAANDDWSVASNASQVATTSASLGAFPLSVGSKDAALLTSVNVGGYTVQVTGASGATGIALVELYDADSAQAASRLVNVSARTQVGTDASILIAGFTIAGTAPKVVLIRGVGPALVPYGVTGTLTDPQLTLFSKDTVLTSNTGWSGAINTAQIGTTAAQVGAFALPNGSADSALLVQLPAGSYTAQLRSASGGTGVGLVEVYEVQ